MLKIEHRSVASLVPYARNARTHSDDQVAQIAASIREFGWTNPILVDGENGIIAVHGRLMAARKLGMAEVPVIELAHLSDTQKRALILADNKLALNAGWDESMLALELSELIDEDFDLDITGFEDFEIDALVKSEPELPQKKVKIVPIKKVRILISVDLNAVPDLDLIIKNLLDKGAEVDYSGN